MTWAKLQNFSSNLSIFWFLEQENQRMATHSSILARRIPRTEEPGGLWFMGSQRVGHNWSDLHTCMHSLTICWKAPTIPLMIPHCLSKTQCIRKVQGPLNLAPTYNLPHLQSPTPALPCRNSVTQTNWKPLASWTCLKIGVLPHPILRPKILSSILHLPLQRIYIFLNY